jgi:tetratricopeptide (TPR) repeat protein
MGLTDWFQRGRGPQFTGDLRDALFDAFKAQDYESLVPLINNNADAIRASFADWLHVPAEIRHDPSVLEAYGKMLFMIWYDTLRVAQQLIDSGRASEAVTSLRDALESMKGATGSAVDDCRPKLLGRLGIALYKSGAPREAADVTRQALELCRQLGDEEGVRTYTNNLKVIGTWEVPANDGSSRNMTIAVCDDVSQTLRLEDLVKVEGRMSWEVHSDESVPEGALRLHAEGRSAAERGDFESALRLLTEAASLAPSWPHPLYDRAFTHLLRQDFVAALSDYRKTLELAPRGFFTTASSVDSLTREAAGEFPTGFYLAFAISGQMPTEQRSYVLEQIVEKFPTFAPGWDKYADLVKEPAQRLQAIESGLAARPDPDTYGSLLIKKACAMWALGDYETSVAMLRKLAAESPDSMSTQVGAQLVLARLVGETGEPTL